MFSSVARFADAAKSAENFKTKKTHIPVKINKASNYKSKLIARFRSLNENLIIVCIECNHWIYLRDEGCNIEFMKKYADNKIVDNFPFKCNKCKSVTDWSIELQQKTQAQIKEYKEAIIKARSEIFSLSQRLLSLESNINYIEQTDCTSFQGVYSLQNDFETSSFHSNSSETSENVEAELHRRFKRRNRVVFLGVSKDYDDKTFVKELSEELELEINNFKIKKTFRLNATHVKPGTLPLNIYRVSR